MSTDMSTELKQFITGFKGVIMSTELKFFIDGVEVKKGDELIRGYMGCNDTIRDNTIIIFDSLNRYGEIVDSEGRLWSNYPDYNGWTEWKRRSLIPKKYAPAIFVFKDDKGNVVSTQLSGELYDSIPSSKVFTASYVVSSRDSVYWPASDYLKDGYYVLPEEC